MLGLLLVPFHRCSVTHRDMRSSDPESPTGARRRDETAGGNLPFVIFSRCCTSRARHNACIAGKMSSAAAHVITRSELQRVWPPRRRRAPQNEKYSSRANSPWGFPATDVTSCHRDAPVNAQRRAVFRSPRTVKRPSPPARDINELSRVGEAVIRDFQGGPDEARRQGDLSRVADGIDHPYSRSRPWRS